jgi:hypothetical protein
MTGGEPVRTWHCDRASPLSDWAEGIAWLWRLGERTERIEGASTVFMDASAAIDGLAAARNAGSRAVVVVATEPGEPAGGIPARRQVSGVASFEGGTRVEGGFLAFEGGEPAVVSSLGTHGITDGEGAVLLLACDVLSGWGRVEQFWVPETILAFLRSRGIAVRPLPPVGCIRLDDFPGTALSQVQSRAHPDGRQARRARRWARWFQGRRATLNLAVACQALEDGERVGLERIWPRAVAAIGEGALQGTFEAVCHGALHLDTEAYERGEIEFREFAKLDEPAAAERIDMAIDWQRHHMSAPHTFVAPAWAYGPASDRVAAERGLVRWHPPRPGVPIVDGRMHETIVDGQFGLWRLDYSPFVRLARAGIPPMVITHGANLDQRLPRLRSVGSLPALVRLLFRRDLLRLAALDGISWIGAGEMARVLEAHGRDEHAGATP